MGLLAGILIFCAIAGNLFLITGAMTDDLADNPIAWIMVIIAIIGDIWIIGSIVSGISQNRENARKEEENRRIAEQEEKEKQIRKRVHDLIAEYSLKSFCPPYQGDLSDSNVQNRNIEVCTCYQEYWASVANIDAEIVALYEKNKVLLNCPGCTTNEQKLDYILQRESELRANRNAAQNLVNKRNKTKICLAEYDVDPLTKLRNALTYLKHSKKCESNAEMTVEAFLDNKQKPALACFSYSVTPVVMNFGKVSAYCFPKVILICSKERFLSAVNPSALKIEVTREEVSATYSLDSKSYFNAPQIAEDSEVVRSGPERTTWLHTCRDGSPDLRYSHNPMHRYRNDVVAYGKVKISINEYAAEFTFSSQKALNLLPAANDAYCVKNGTVGNPIPVLLKLLTLVQEDAGSVAQLNNAFEARGKKEMAVCSIVTSE